MNKEYTYIDGNVIIRDENGKQYQTEYYDNLDKVLVQENLVETIENKINELEKESVQYGNVPKHYIPITIIMFAIMVTIGVPIILYWLTGNNPLITSINTKFGTMRLSAFVSSMVSVLGFPFFGLLELNIYQQYKATIKEGQGINSELEYLKNQIVIEKQALEDLKKEKTQDEENKEFRVVEVNDTEKLKELRNYLNLYYNLGYNIEKYYKYYEQGKLDDKLKKQYNNEDINLAIEYLQEKGPTLVKKKKTTK